MSLRTKWIAIAPRNGLKQAAWTCERGLFLSLSEAPVANIRSELRTFQKLRRPMCVWLTGLPGAGKSTIANLLKAQLFTAGNHAYVLDGDLLRQGLNRDLGYSPQDRVENIRRVVEVARLFVDAGFIAIVALISPFRAERNAARLRFADEEFIEVFVDAPLEVCERRDPKGLYARARSGELKHFTGIDSPYESPLNPDVLIDTVKQDPDQCVNQLLTHMVTRVPQL